MAPKEIEETLRKDRTGVGDKGKGWRSENDNREIEGRGKGLGKERGVADDVDLVILIEWWNYPPVKYAFTRK